MSWLSLRIQANEENAEILSEALMTLGALSVSIEDAHADTEAEQPIFGEPGDPPPGVWQENWVIALLDQETNVNDLIQQLKDNTGFSDLNYSVETIEEQDWVRQTQSQFNPIPITDNLWIVPTWHEAPNPTAINIILDPGLAFGTGSHPTTHLCLEWLAKLPTLGSVLDYGCGSGILAIAAKKLGAEHVIGVDIDPQAVISSRHNAEANQVDVTFYDSSVYFHDRFDIVVANILSSALSVLAPVIALSCKTGGRVALSGILEAQQNDLIAIFNEWFEMDPPIIREGWVLLTGTRRSEDEPSENVILLPTEEDASSSAQTEAESSPSTDVTPVENETAPSQIAEENPDQTHDLSIDHPHVTSCPECNTQFIVKDEHLKAYNGMVRCGTCQHVFNAHEHFVTEILPSSPDHTAESRIEAVLKSVNLQDEITSVATEFDLLGKPLPENTAQQETKVKQAQEFELDSLKPKKSPKSFSVLVMIFTLVLLLVLLVQLIFNYRTEISARYPQTAPWLKLACQFIGCQVDLPKHIQLLTIDDANMQEDTEHLNVLQFTSTLVNHATYPQAYPLVELTLTDTNDQPVLRKTFQPKEYIGNNNAVLDGIGANEEIHISLRLSSEITVAGYRVTLKY